MEEPDPEHPEHPLASPKVGLWLEQVPRQGGRSHCAQYSPPRRGAWELSVTCKESKIESMLVCS